MAATVHGKPWKIALADIDTIWVKTGSRAGIIGASVAVPFAILGIFAGSALACGDEPSPCSGQANGAVIGAFIFAAIGAIPAAILGSMITHWSLIFVRASSP